VDSVKNPNLLLNRPIRARRLPTFTELFIGSMVARTRQSARMASDLGPAPPDY